MNFRILLFTTLLISLGGFSQEKRLALVIGNSNYENAPVLQNPLNDALLMKETFDKLGFEVIIETDIETREEFIKVIDEYNERRKNYSVGFVYYAGHAVQLDGINYMLATKESYETASNVKYKGLAIDIFTDQFIDPTNNEVNVLILDACRNNPFEQKIYGGTRAIENGLGLAEIKIPPLGSIIAFSTEKGKTAKDQIEDSKNSFYCQTLSSNMLLEGVSLHNIFGKTCSEVYKETNQYPEVYDKMMGNDFFLKKTSFTDKIIEIDSLIELNKFDLAREKTIAILALSPNNKDALLRRGRIQYNTLGKGYDGLDLYKALELYPKDPEVFIYLARFYSTTDQAEKALAAIEKSIGIDSSFSEAYFWKARILNEDMERTDEAFDAISEAIKFAAMDHRLYDYRASMYEENNGDCDNALSDYSNAIRLNPTNEEYWFKRGLVYDVCLNDNSSALKQYEQILKLNPENIDAINGIGLIFKEEGKLNQAIEQFTKGITMQKNSPIGASFCFENIADIHREQQKYDEALKEYNMAIELALEKGPHFYNRAKFYMEYLEEYESALDDFNEAIRLEPENTEYLFDRGFLFAIHMDNENRALIDWENLLKIDPINTMAINNIGTIYKNQNKIELAIDQYTMGIELKNSNPEEAAYCYGNRAILYVNLGRIDEALSDYSNSIVFADDKAFRYHERGLFFRDNKMDFQNAFDDFSEAIKLDPLNIEYLYDRGSLLYDNLNKDNQALKDFQEILKIDPGNVDAINYVGVIYESQGKTDLAIKEYEKGITLEIENPYSASFCYRNRAEIYADLGLSDEALKDYSKAIELDPQNSDWYYIRATFYEEYQNDYNKALLDYSTSIQLNPMNLENIYARALLYQDYLGDMDGALEDGKIILMNDSLNIKAMNLCSSIYIENKQLDSAIIILNKGIALNSIDKESTVFCYLNRADIYAKRGELQSSIEDFDKAISLEPENANSYASRAWFFYDYMFDLKKAIDDFNRAIELDKKNPTYYLNRAMVHLKLNDTKSQIEDLNQAIKLSSNNPQLYCERGIFYALQGQFNKAESDYSQAFLIDSMYYNVHLFKSKLFILKGDLKNALNAIDEAIKIEPNDPEHYFMKGKIYEQLGLNLHASKNYSLAEGLIEQGLYYVTDDNAVEIEKSDIIYRVGQFYEKINEFELACEEYRKVQNLVQDDYRYHYLSLKNIVEQKIEQHCIK